MPGRGKGKLSGLESVMSLVSSETSVAGAGETDKARAEREEATSCRGLQTTQVESVGVRIQT